MPIRRPNLKPRQAAGARAVDEPSLAMDGFVTVRVVQLAEIIARGASQVFEQRFGVKNTELRILVQLGKHPLAVNELARRTRIDKGWISRSLRGLEQRGLVQRTIHPTDSRATLTALTAQGDQLVGAFAPVAQARNQRLLAGLDEAEVHGLLDALFLRAEDILLNPDLSGPAALPAPRVRRAMRPR